MDKDNDEYRLTSLEIEVDIIGADVKKILTNHLPHIETKIAVLMAQMVVVLAALAYLLFS
jgi:hypothetical protein